MVTLNSSIVNRLSAQLDGTVILPADNGYNEARRVFNLLVDKLPAIIIRCHNEEDVRIALAFGREQDLPVAIRSGGHNYAGKAVVDDGLIIDMTPMRRFEVDPLAGTLTAQSGFTLIEIDRLLQAVGYVLPVGVVGATGMAGLALGGGLGWTTGRFGLTVDNILSLDMISADGRKITADSEQNPDLFWALRGGCGNFGVVTSFKFKIHKHSEVLFGSLCYPASKAKELLRIYKEFTLDIPDELALMGGLIPMVDGERFRILGCYNGDLKEGEKVFDRLRSFSAPVLDTVKKTTYLHVQETAFPLPAYLKHYIRSSFYSDLPADLISAAAARINEGGPTCALLFQSFHGAPTRVPLEDTAFPFRKKGHVSEVQTAIIDDKEQETLLDWTDKSFEAIDKYSDNTNYVNYLTIGEDYRTREAYGPHWDRLVSIKRKYDPDNVFKVNFNIDPGG